MSLLALLATAATTTDVPTDSGPQPPPPGSPTTASAPTPTDPIVALMRPADEPIATVVVALDGSGDHQTIPDAVAWAMNRQAAHLAYVGRTEPGPADRIRFLIGPGRHQVDSNQAFPPFSEVIALDPTRGATSVWPGIEPSGSVYWEGIDTENLTNSFEPKYGAHVHLAGLMVFTRCTLWNSAPSSGGGTTAIGMDGGNGGMIVLHDMTLGPGGANLHGWADLTSPETIVYSQVTCLGGSIGFDAISTTTPDQLWVVASDVAGVYFNSTKTGTLHLDPQTKVGANGVTCSGTQDSRADWPVPVGWRIPAL